MNIIKNCYKIDFLYEMMQKHDSGIEIIDNCLLKIAGKRERESLSASAEPNLDT